MRDFRAFVQSLFSSSVKFILGYAVPPLVDEGAQQNVLLEARVLVHHPVHGSVAAPRLKQPRVALHSAHHDVAHRSAHEGQFELGNAQVKRFVPQAPADQGKQKQLDEGKLTLVESHNGRNGTEQSCKEHLVLAFDSEVVLLDCPLQEAHDQHEQKLDSPGSAPEPRHLEFDLLDQVFEAALAEAFEQDFDNARFQKHFAELVLRVGEAFSHRHGAAVN